MEGPQSEGELALNDEGGESSSSLVGYPKPLSRKSSIQERIKVFNNACPAPDLPRNASPFMSPMRKTLGDKVQRHQEQQVHQLERHESVNNRGSAAKWVENGDESSVAEDDNDHKETTLPTRSWKVKRIKSTDSYPLENSHSSDLFSGDNPEDERFKNTEMMTSHSSNDETENSEDKEDDPGSRRSWKVKRVMSIETFRKEQNPGSGAHPLSAIAGSDGSPSDEDHSTQGDSACSEEETTSPRRSWKVKRVVSNDEFLKENPDTLASLATASGELPANNASQSTELSPQVEEVTSNRRSWTAKRIMSNDSFRRANPDILAGVPIPENEDLKNTTTEAETATIDHAKHAQPKSGTGKVNQASAISNYPTTPNDVLSSDRKMTPKNHNKLASITGSDTLTPKMGKIPYELPSADVTPKMPPGPSKPCATADAPNVSTPKRDATSGSKPGWSRKNTPKRSSTTPQPPSPANDASGLTHSSTPSSANGSRKSYLMERINHFQGNNDSTHSSVTMKSNSTTLSAATTGLEGRLRSPKKFLMNAGNESNPLSRSSHVPHKKLSLGVVDVTKSRHQTKTGMKQNSASTGASPSTGKGDLNLEEFAEGDEYIDLEEDVGNWIEKSTILEHQDSSLPERLPLNSYHSRTSSHGNDSIASIFSEDGDTPRVRTWNIKRVTDAQTLDHDTLGDTPEGQGQVEEGQEPRRSWKVKRVVSAKHYEEELAAGVPLPEPRAIGSPPIPSAQKTNAGHSSTKVFQNKKNDYSVQQGSMEGLLSPRHTLRGPRAVSTGSAYITSPPKTAMRKENVHETLATEDDSLAREEKTSDGGSPPVAPGDSSVVNKVPSLKDRIGMFSKNSTVPDFARNGGRPGFLNPKHMRKLAVVKEVETKRTRNEGNNTESAKMSPRVKAQKRGSDLMPGKKTIIEQNRLPHRPLTTIKDLLPPPTKSLDVKQNEVVERKLERFNSFQNRRGRLRATRSALLGQKSGSKKDIFMPVAAKQVGDLSTFKPPHFPKDTESIHIINAALSKNFVFEDLKDEELEQFVMAFEQVKMSQGEIIMKQGDVGDYFYVVAFGEVSVHVNEKKVAIIKAGNSFGEMSLLYTCPRAATVVAESQPTRLFRVDQKTFRYIMQAQTKKSEETKEQLLRDITFLEHLSSEDIHRLCSVMTPCLFSTGDYIVKRGERGDSFYVIQEGKVRVTDIIVGNIRYEDVTLGAGDYFGEGALISSESRAANVVALTKGTAFAIDRKTFQKVIGDFVKLISKAQDRQRLEGIKVLRDADLTSEHINELASHLVDKEFEPNQTIFKEGQTVEGALYIVREGTLKISSSDGSRCEEIVPGGYFGQEQLLADMKGKRDKAKYSVVVGEEQCVCGILTLKDCRSVFDTTAMEDGSYTGGSSYKLSKRQSVKDAIKKEVSLDSMKKEYMLGEGQFAEVWLVSADLPLGRQEFALKIQHCDDEVRHDSALESIRREITVLQQLHHPFIVDLVATFDKDDGSIYMLMEAVKGGELWSVIHQESEDGEWKSGLSESHAKFYSLLMADTLAYMHREKFVFRDLKPENVLIDEEGYPIIVDFGFAKYCPDKTYTFCGTPNYLAPEIVTNRGHGAGVDHWALGVVTYEMITGENPFYFEDMNQMALFQAIVQEPMFPPGDDASPDLIDFLSGLLEKDPIQRLGMLAGRERDVLRHKWFADLDFDKMRNREAKAPWIPKIKG